MSKTKPCKPKPKGEHELVVLIRQKNAVYAEQMAMGKPGESKLFQSWLDAAPEN